MLLPIDEMVAKLWLALISRGAEIDDPSVDDQYLKIEKTIILLNEFFKTGEFSLELSSNLEDLKI